MAFPATFLDIKNAVIAKARLDATQDISAVADWINQTYREVCLETEFFQFGSATVTLTAQSTVATVPNTVIGIDYVVSLGSDGTLWGPMEMVTMEEVLEKQAFNTGTPWTGAPTRYAFVSGQNPTIMFWPAANGGEVLTFWGWTFPPVLVADGDLPIFPEPYASKCLEYGALVQGAEFKKDIIMLNQFQQLFQDWTSRFRALNNRRVGNKTQQFRVERQFSWPRVNNSTDYGGSWY